MPFSKTTDIHTEDYWKDFFETFITPALAAHGYKAEKSVAAPNNITKQIIKELAMADLVPAVLTDGKANVFYELGVRHSLRQGTVMILEEARERPFDISNYGILSYMQTNLTKFTDDLGRYMKIADDMNEDSPVADFLNQRITVSVNLAIGKLRECVQIVKDPSKATLEFALDDLRKLQSTWDSERVQVSVVSGGQLVLHVLPSLQNTLQEENWWRDETLDNKPFVPIHEGFAVGFQNRTD